MTDVGTVPGAGESLIIQFRSELVGLGPIRRELLPTYQRWINDFGTLRTLGVPPQPTTLEGEQQWYDRASVGDDKTFTIYELKSERPIGVVSLRSIDFRNRTASYGLMIGEPDARGRGYGTEATMPLQRSDSTASISAAMSSIGPGYALMRKQDSRRLDGAASAAGWEGDSGMR
jgi:hypothetical protein